MAHLDLPSFQKHLAAFNFNSLFVEVLGWEHPPRGGRDWQAEQIKGVAFSSAWWRNWPAWLCCKS